MSVGCGSRFRQEPLATALGYAACLQGYSVRFTTAIDAINTLSAAHGSGRLKTEIKKYLKPRVLILDELGYLPIDKNGAELLFQVISGRYERGSLRHCQQIIFTSAIGPDSIVR